MKRSTFIKNLVGLYGFHFLPTKTIKHYQKIYLLQCFVRGFRYYEGPKLISKLNSTGLINMVREPHNKYDENAIALYFNQYKIGFVPAESNDVLSRLIDAKLLNLQAEITHVEPKAATWENVHIAIYALKELLDKDILEDYPDFDILETPEYYTLKSGKENYTRIYFDDDGYDDPEDYYNLLVENSSSDRVYDLIHHSFENSHDFEEAFKNSKIIVKRNEVSNGIAGLFEKIEGRIVEIENYFGEDNYIVANVDEIVKIPDRIEHFVEVFDKAGNKFYELILKL